MANGMDERDRTLPIGQRPTVFQAAGAAAKTATGARGREPMAGSSGTEATPMTGWRATGTPRAVASKPPAPDTMTGYGSWTGARGSWTGAEGRKGGTYIPATPTGMYPGVEGERHSLPATTRTQPAAGPAIDRSAASENVAQTVAQGVEQPIKDLTQPRIIDKGPGGVPLLTNMPQPGEAGRFEPLAPGTTIPDYRSTPNVPRDITTYKPGQYGPQMTDFGPAWTGGSQDVASRARAGAVIAQEIINTLKASGDLYKLDVGFLNNLVNNIAGLEQTGLTAQGGVYGQQMGLRGTQTQAAGAERGERIRQAGDIYKTAYEQAAAGTIPGMGGAAANPADVASQAATKFLRSSGSAFYTDAEGNMVEMTYGPDGTMEKKVVTESEMKQRGIKPPKKKPAENEEGG